MSRRTGKHRIYMNVGYDLTEQQLRDFFNQYGNITDVYLPKHKSGRNKGFGFTTFDSEEGLQSALSAQEYIIGGDIVKINRAGPRPEYEAGSEAAESAAAGSDADNRQAQSFGKGPRLYVGGVPDEVTEERLKAHFSRWGNVVDLYFPGKKGQSRVNYCFVTFDNWRAAQRACNQSERNIDGLPLQSINLAQERTAEQEQARADAAAAALVATSSSLEAPQAAAAPAAAPAAPAPFNFGGLATPSHLALLQHFQMQAQIQAQQAGYNPQQHALLQRLIAGQATPNLDPVIPPHQSAYQQMMSSMLAQQSSMLAQQNTPALSLNPQMPHMHSSAGVPPYDMAAAASPPLMAYPQNFGSMDLNAVLTAQAQASDKLAAEAHRLPQPYAMQSPAPQMQRGMSRAASINSAFSLPSAASADLSGGMNPLMWGWGGSAGVRMLPDTANAEIEPRPQSRSDFLMPANARIAAAAAVGQSGNSGGQMQLPVAVLSTEGFGPTRTHPGRARKNSMPY